MMYFKVVNGRVEIDAKTILEEVNLEIKDKDHIAIIGRNGAGKSTLLKAIINPKLFSEGVGEEKFGITTLGSFHIGFLKQNAGLTENHTLLEEILEVYKPIIQVERKLKELESKLESGSSSIEDANSYVELEEYYKNIGGYDYKKEYLTALTKNGFTTSLLDKKISAFSGGEQTKISFIKLVLSKPDLLLLDEPTNHLDILGVEWLEEYLRNYPKTFIVVSHDRMFINRVANKIYEIEYGETTLYHGNYENYEKEKKARREAYIKSYERQQKEIARLQRIADRFRYKPSKARMAMSKLKQIERMVKLEVPEKENYTTFHANFADFKESGKVVLSVEHLKFGYTSTLGEATFTLNKGKRLGIVGGNGSGKSTLLKTIMGYLPALAGTCEFGFHVTTAYFDQQFDTLDTNLTIYEDFKEKFPFKNDFEIRSALASFMFYPEDINKKIAVLSGGEKVRLALCEVVFSNANFLILDEPTNHLDILSKEKLEDILVHYPGTILFVSHDRYFIQKIADSILDFDGKNVTYYDYTYDDYLMKKNEREEPVKEIEKGTQKVKKENKKVSHSLDKQISKLEGEIEELKKELFLEEVYTNKEKYQEVEAKINDLEEKLNELLLHWD